MFRNLFRPDSGLMITMNQITDCIFLSLFWLLGCAPVVTVGASFAALYDAVWQVFRRGEKHGWQRFFKTYQENWKVSVVPALVFLGAVSLLVRGLIGAWNAAVAGAGSWMMFSGGAFLAVTVVGILSVLFPMLSRFENPALALLKNTLLMALANLPRTILLGILNAMTAFACIRWVVPLFFLPALAALIGTWLIEPMFRPYMTEIDN